MSKKNEVIVLQAQSAEKIEKFINNNIDEGYEVYGSMAVNAIPYNGDIIFNYVQVMRLAEEIEEEVEEEDPQLPIRFIL